MTRWPMCCAVFEQMGRIGLVVLLAGFALFLAHKWWRRQQHRQLRMARITPQELLQLTQGERPAVILDVRTELSRGGGGIIPGALL